MNKTKINRLKELIEQLNKYSDAYYNGESIVTDEEFDKLYDELVELEKETETYFSNSPARKVGYEVKNKLPKIKHDVPMLSLDKCRDVQELINFAGDDDCYISVKCDGLSTRLIYRSEDGVTAQLVQAITRGDGENGSDVTFHLKQYENVPLTIPYGNTLIIDGESVIFYDDFNKINEKLSEEEKFKNPRNLASGTLATLDSSITKERHLKFIAWRVIEGFDGDSNFFKLKEAKELGFTMSPTWTYNNNSVDKDIIEQMLKNLKETATNMGLPIDGAVLAKDSISLAINMGRTEKFFRHSIAYKYEDQVEKTTLKDVEWTMGRTNSLNPTAIFNTVIIDGTEVSRASCHNVTYLKNMNLHIGDEIGVFKSGMIIPQIRENYTKHNLFDSSIIVDTCPICGARTEIIQENETEVLICTNYNCQGKRLGQLNHFVSKECLNIDGFSEKGLELLIEKGFISEYYDIYTLCEHKDELINLDRFGKRKVEKLLQAIEDSKNCDLVHFITAFGIPLIGKTASKLISKECHGDFMYFVEMMDMHFDWTKIQGFGDTMYSSLFDWWVKNRDMMQKLALLMNFKIEENKIQGYDLEGKTFCITGSLDHFKNRDELVQNIEQHNGKVVSGVSKKTNYLINNDTESTSSKNKKAKELNIPIISEMDYLRIIKQ